MKEITKNDFEYLGPNFSIRLLAQIITDKQFADGIMDILDANYFEDEFLRKIAITIKTAHEEDGIIPDFDSIKYRLMEEVNDNIMRDFVLKQLKVIEEADMNDVLYIQRKANNFCKTQEMKRAWRDVNKIIEMGNVDNYDKCEAILKKALEIGDNKDKSINVTSNIEAAIADDFRNPISTGIRVLDEVMEGGLAKGELGVIVAPFGVGKTTVVTKLANSAKFDHNTNTGKNVLQIFFEDLETVIQRKHLSCWTGYQLNDLNLHKDELRELVVEKDKEAGEIRLVKFPSYGTTVNHIKAFIRKKIAEGFKPDMVLFDYVDCISPSEKVNDVYVGEGNVMREIETLLSEFDIAGWVAVQGNKESISADVVQANQIAGSIKKGQIGHFILSIAKSLPQKENGTANLAILKSRFGKDGIVYNDIIFDNGNINIDIKKEDAGTSFLGQKKRNENIEQERVNVVMSAAQKRIEERENLKEEENKIIVNPPEIGGAKID